MSKKTEKNKTLKNPKRKSAQSSKIDHSNALSASQQIKNKNPQKSHLKNQKSPKKKNFKNKILKKSPKNNEILTPIKSKKNIKKITTPLQKISLNKKIIKINLQKSRNKILKKNPKKIINFIDWSNINSSSNFDFNILNESAPLFEKKSSYNYEAFNSQGCSPQALFKKIKEEINSKKIEFNYTNFNSQDCPLNYAKKRVSKYIANRRAKNSYNNHQLSLTKKIKNESLIRNNDNQNNTKH